MTEYDSPLRAFETVYNFESRFLRLAWRRSVTWLPSIGILGWTALLYAMGYRPVTFENIWFDASLLFVLISCIAFYLYDEVCDMSRKPVRPVMYAALRLLPFSLLLSAVCTLFMVVYFDGEWTEWVVYGFVYLIRLAPLLIGPMLFARIGDPRQGMAHRI